MREIVTLHVGGCGIRMGETLWEMFAREHSIDCDGKPHSTTMGRATALFSEQIKGRYIPRAIFTDLDVTPADELRSGKLGRLFNPDNTIVRNFGTHGNWAEGKYTNGAELCDTLMDAVRHEFERCESAQGLVITHAIGGGTGSGYFSLILSKLLEQYPDIVVCNTAVFPAPSCPSNVVEPYNAASTIHEMIQQTCFTTIVDNDALRRICALTKGLDVGRPSYADLNLLIANSISAMTGPSRFQSDPSRGLRKMVVDLVPFPRVHFPVVCAVHGFADDPEPESPAVLGAKLIRRQTALASNVSQQGDGFAAEAVYCKGSSASGMKMPRGALKIPELRKSSVVSDVVVPANCSVPQFPWLSNLHLWTTTSDIAPVIERILQQYRKMIKRHAFSYWFTGVGLDSMELTEIESCVSDIVSELQQYAHPRDPNDGGEEEEAGEEAP
jgi:tubulin beta